MKRILPATMRGPLSATLDVSGQRELPTGGQRDCPVKAKRYAHRWPLEMLVQRRLLGRTDDFGSGHRGRGSISAGLSSKNTAKNSRCCANPLSRLLGVAPSSRMTREGVQHSGVRQIARPRISKTPISVAAAAPEQADRGQEGGPRSAPAIGMNIRLAGVRQS
jgi:hypothetical protein